MLQAAIRLSEILTVWIRMQHLILSTGQRRHLEFKMKKLKFTKRIFTVFMAFALIFGSVRLYQMLAPSTAYAVGDLAVNWGVAEGNPIFTINNMAPGQVETRSVIVTNNAVSVRPVGVRGV